MPAPPNAPRFTYPVGGTVLNMLLPAHLGESTREYIGGTSESGAGVPESYVIRKQGLYTVTLLIDETQQDDVQALVDYCVDYGSAAIIRFTPDQNILGVYHDCWLISPNAGKKLEMRKLDSYVRAFTTEFILKRADLAGFNRVLP
jgi:hypothetical protein